MAVPIQTGMKGWEKWNSLSWDGVNWNIRVISSAVEGSVFRIDHSQGVQGGQEFPPPSPTPFIGIAQKKFRLYAGPPGRHPPSHYTTCMSSSAWNSRRLERVGNSGIPWEIPGSHRYPSLIFLMKMKRWEAVLTIPWAVKRYGPGPSLPR